MEESAIISACVSRHQRQFATVGISISTFHAAWDAVKSWLQAQCDCRQGATIHTFARIAWAQARPSTSHGASSSTGSHASHSSGPLFILGSDNLLKAHGLTAGAGVTRANAVCGHTLQSSEPMNFSRLALRHGQGLSKDDVAMVLRHLLDEVVTCMAAGSHVEMDFGVGTLSCRDRRLAFTFRPAYGGGGGGGTSGIPWGGGGSRPHTAQTTQAAMAHTAHASQAAQAAMAQAAQPGQAAGTACGVDGASCVVSGAAAADKGPPLPSRCVEETIESWKLDDPEPHATTLSTASQRPPSTAPHTTPHRLPSTAQHATPQAAPHAAPSTAPHRAQQASTSPAATHSSHGVQNPHSSSPIPAGSRPTTAAAAATSRPAAVLPGTPPAHGQRASRPSLDSIPSAVRPGPSGGTGEQGEPTSQVVRLGPVRPGPFDAGTMAAGTMAAGAAGVVLTGRAEVPPAGQRAVLSSHQEQGRPLTAFAAAQRHRQQPGPPSTLHGQQQQQLDNDVQSAAASGQQRMGGPPVQHQPGVPSHPTAAAAAQGAQQAQLDTARLWPGRQLLDDGAQSTTWRSDMSDNMPLGASCSVAGLSASPSHFLGHKGRREAGAVDTRRALSKSVHLGAVTYGAVDAPTAAPLFLPKKVMYAPPPSLSEDGKLANTKQYAAALLRSYLTEQQPRGLTEPARSASPGRGNGLRTSDSVLGMSCKGALHALGPSSRTRARFMAESQRASQHMELQQQILGERQQQTIQSWLDHSVSSSHMQRLGDHPKHPQDARPASADVHYSASVSGKALGALPLLYRWD